MPGPLNHLKHQRHLKHLVGSLAADGGGGSAWTPASYGGTFDGWYDASLKTGGDGDPMTLPDSSNAGHDTSSASPPTLLNAGLNGLNVLVGDGTQGLTATSSPSSTYTVFLVAKFDSLAGVSFMLAFGGVCEFLNILGSWSWYANSAGGGQSLGTGDTNWHLFKLNLDMGHSPNPLLVFSMDGSVLASFQPSGSSGGTTIQTILISDAFSAPVAGKMAEYIKVQESLTPIQETQFEDYLTNKWGL